LAEGLQVGPVPDGAVLVHILISEGDRWIVADSHRVLLSGVPAPPVRRVYPTRTGGLDYTLTTSGARAVRRVAEVVLEVQGTVAWRIGGGGNLWNGFGGASGTVSLSGWSGSSMKVGGDKGFRYRLFKFVTPIQPEDPLAPAPLPELLGLYEAVLERHSAFQHPAWRALASQFAEVRPTLPPVPGREPVVVPAGERFPRRISRVIVHDREALARIPESTHIQSLVILDPEFSDRHLAKLRGRNATENVDLRETTVRGPGLAVLRGFLGLRALVLPAALSRDAADEHLAPKCRSALGPGLLRDREATSFLDALAVAQADIEATVGKVELVELRFGGNGSKMTGGFFQKQRLDYRTAKLLIHGGRGSTEIQIRLERVGQARDWSVAELDLVPLSR